MRLRNLIAAAALSSVFFTHNNAKAEPISDDVLNGMFDKPNGSYVLLPDPSPYDNVPYFKLVVKEDSIKNTNAFNASGKHGTSLCADYNIISATLDSNGSLHPIYTGHVWLHPVLNIGLPVRKVGYALSDMKPSTLLAIPEEDSSWDLDVEKKQICKFVID